MKPLLLIIAFLLIKTTGYAQDNNLPTRDAFKLTLAVNDTNFYAVDIKQSAYVLPDNTVQMYPGEKIYLEADFVNHELKAVKSVKSIVNPEKTITISFDQHKEGKKHQQMVLKVINPFGTKLKYQASIFLMKQYKWVKTDVLPVEAKLAAFETWPDVIVTIALSGWQLE
ncbi:hypothetical protein [Mucilaginibacter paludis]|uniref:Uncharacterized protein n=1 Tax=Mucilaginibacter paludis DSM 18603 TaxID=714943 RepID=H1Y7M4_9SPHI|nr:hypothetical protein [Mucilaginibacter paludis]EHQ29869.1 hypothetical protein Mucpa_5802 [Mucilaginibacter paludis DSM 18603]